MLQLLALKGFFFFNELHKKQAKKQDGPKILEWLFGYFH
jgi:hypothetical protein